MDKNLTANFFRHPLDITPPRQEAGFLECAKNRVPQSSVSSILSYQEQLIYYLNLFSRQSVQERIGPMTQSIFPVIKLPLEVVSVIVLAVFLITVCG